VNDEAELARKHYKANEQQEKLVQSVKALLEKMGDGPISNEQLAGLDQFHAGGLEMTARFLELLDLEQSSKVLDAGSGLGGPSRFAADKYGCEVVGVDLVDSFVEVAQLLAQRVSIAGSVSYQVGNLMALDFKDAQFDVVYSQHVVMNIPNRSQVYSEIQRVLKPGGTFGFYDVLATDGKPSPYFPVPWAEKGDQSFLWAEHETREALEKAGFAIQQWKDVTQVVIEWADQRQSLTANTPDQGPSLKLVLGERMAEMSANFASNLRENKVRIVMATSTRI
jgi:ubiquinone/menaquinone biosynthesis C-methylase UbiE